MVHISKVEIFGFKSFGFRNTTVNFEPGLVSISGPNGSGKSNILDAIMFALGEKRPSILRAPSLRKLIHDIDSESRRGPKMTRVSVHFDNTDRKIPLDSDSVTFTREMDDKGEHIYYLDKKKTTRTQIVELLEMANAGLNQLNTVQQGTVMRISEFTPEEKRQTIEHLIGLSYFDEKKAEAVKQLDVADRRLEVAMAKMGEIKKRIDELEEERNVKLRYDLISREINKFNAIVAANELKTIESTKISKERNLHALSSEMKKFEEERDKIRKEAHEIEGQKKAFMDEVNAYNHAKASIETELTAAIQKFEQEKSEIDTSKKRLVHIDSRLPEIESDLEQLHTERSSLESQIIPLKESIRKTSEEQRSINEEVKSLDSQHNQIAREQHRVSSQKTEVDHKIKNLVTKLNAAQLYHSKIQNEIDDLQEKIQTNTNRTSATKLDIAKLQTLSSKLESVRENHKATIEEIKSRIGKHTDKQAKIEHDVEELSLILEKSTKAATQYEAKIRIVKNIMHEDYSIAKLKEDSKKLGIEGLVYELISWDKKYERSILAVNSDWLKALVVEDFVTLVSLAEVAKSRKLPKLKIIPLDATSASNITPPKDKDIIGVLSEYVSCDGKYAGLKRFLFGNVILVESRDAAHRLSKQGYKAVTIDGEFFEAKTSAVVVDIDSKISKLTNIISLSTSIDGLTQSINLLKNFTRKKKNLLKNVENSVKNYRDRLGISVTGLSTTQSSYSDLKFRMISSMKMISNLESRNAQYARKVERMTAELTKQSSYIASLEERISIVQQNYADPEQTRILNELTRLSEKRSAVLAKQTEIVTQLREKQTQLGNLTANEESDKNKMKNLNQENSSLKHEKNELEVKLRLLEKEHIASDESLVKLRDKEQELISTSGGSVDQMKQFDDKLKDLRDTEHTQNKEISALERQSDAINRDLKDIAEKETQILKTMHSYGYSKDIETFEVEPLLQALFAEQRGLSQKINTKAPQDYVTISEGYRSMSTRKNELEKERNSIVKFIEEIEKDKRQNFLDAFDVVDKEIREIFSKMTGGNAWMEIQDEDNIFTSGLSYIIQFPNKPKRESTSISGGEKTLAAVVFVLALQKLKPSPFYLFDEVDAHLDAPNAEKLSNIIEERSQGSQFIMVSLKDSVVEKAKLIYGVYPKNGVSNVVTYKDKRMHTLTN